MGIRRRSVRRQTPLPSTASTKRKRGSMIFAFRRKCRASSSSKSGSRTGALSATEVLNVRQFTSVFDAITKDKPTLAGFLRSLPVIEAPWDGAFQERFCVECGADSCDDCPNEQFRNNPEWWLSLPAADGGAGRRSARGGACRPARRGREVYLRSALRLHSRADSQRTQAPGGYRHNDGGGQCFAVASPLRLRC